MTDWQTTPSDVAQGLWVADEDLPMLAAYWLAEGYDSPLLVELASMSRRDGDDARRILPNVLSELGHPIALTAVVHDERPPPDTSSPAFDHAHPTFSAHFTASVYKDLAGEFSPFGTDEGFDLLAGWTSHIEDLIANQTLRYLLAAELDGGPTVEAAFFEPMKHGDIDAAFTIISAGFTVLRLTGRIDNEGRAAIFEALASIEREYGPQSDLTTMTRDLTTFPAT